MRVRNPHSNVMMGRRLASIRYPVRRRRLRGLGGLGDITDTSSDLMLASGTVDNATSALSALGVDPSITGALSDASNTLFSVGAALGGDSASGSTSSGPSTSTLLLLAAAAAGAYFLL